MRQSLVEIASNMLTSTSSKHCRINVVQSMVDTGESPPLMCMLVLWGTVWQIHMFATNSWRQRPQRNPFKWSSKTAGNCVFGRNSAVCARDLRTF